MTKLSLKDTIDKEFTRYTVSIFSSISSPTTLFGKTL